MVHHNWMFLLNSTAGSWCANCGALRQGDVKYPSRNYRDDGRNRAGKDFVSMGISERVAWSLVDHGIKTREDLASCTSKELRKIKGIGRVALIRIKNALHTYCMALEE